MNEAFAWPDVPPNDASWTPRRLWALVQGLPAEAATWRDKPASWTPQLELMATLVEVTSQGQVKVPRPNGARAEGPPKGDNVVSIADFVSKFGAHAKGGE